jgi:hypothetical protein
MQRRLESTRVGRLLISALVVAIVGGLVVWNLPTSKLRTEGLRVAGPGVRAVGLDQNWSVFAPDPYRDSFFLVARVTYADGSTGAWAPPEGGDALGAYWDFRWGKWAEWTVAGNADLCRGTADYVLRELAGEGTQATRVELLARRRVNARPGEEPTRGPWRTSTVCTADVDPAEGVS